MSLHDEIGRMSEDEDEALLEVAQIVREGGAEALIVWLWPRPPLDRSQARADLQEVGL